MPFDESVESEIRRFEEQFRNQPESLVFARLADAYRKSGDPVRALEVLDEGIARHPDYLSAHIVRARTCRDLGRTDEAREAFERVIEIDAQNLVAFRGLAELARVSGDEAEEFVWLERLEQADPQNEDAASRLAEIRGQLSSEAYDRGKTEEAAQPAAETAESDEQTSHEDADVAGLSGSDEPPRSLDREEETTSSSSLDPELEDLVSQLWSGPAVEPVKGRVADSFAEELNAAILDDETPERSGTEPDGPATSEAWWFEPQGEAGEGLGGEAGDEDEEDADLLTRTMAELYARQGLIDEAEAIYRELLVDRPGDETLRAGLEAVLGMRAARAAKPSVERERRPELEPAPPAAQPGGGADQAGEPDSGLEARRPTAGDRLRSILRAGEEIADRLPDLPEAEPLPEERSVLERWLEGLRN